jgi:hypothetical protein
MRTKRLPEGYCYGPGNPHPVPLPEGEGFLGYFSSFFGAVFFSIIFLANI